jgi:VanZ family protein
VIELRHTDMLTLRYKPLWIVASVILVLGVAWGSLQTRYGFAVPHGFDKVEHFSSYMFLAVWFTGLVQRPRYWLAMLGLLGLGVTLEFTQWVMHAGRTGDPYDMAANTCGVVAGLALALLLTGGWAQRVEAWLTAR